MAKRDIYIRSAALLAGGMLIAKIIGAIYRIPLTNIIGAEGIGIYQMVFPVYALLITLTASGIPIVVSKMVAEMKINGNYATAKIMFRKSVGVFFVIALIAAGALSALSGVMGSIQDMKELTYAYLLIAPAIVFSTLIAAYRGWFQGNMNMMPSALSQIIEQLVKLITGLTLAKIFIKQGTMYAVWAVLFSITLSEAIALFMLLIYYIIKHDRSKEISGADLRVNGMFKELSQALIPVTLGGLMLPLVQFIDSLMIVNLLRNSGVSQVMSTKMFGILSGPVGSLINMPVVLTLAFAVTVIPVVSGSKARRDIDSIRAKSRSGVKLTFVIGVPSALALFALSEPVMSVLYPNFDAFELRLASGLLKITSISILLMSVMQIYTALLQAIDRAYTPFTNMALGGGIKVALTIILIRSAGIYGAAISTIIAYAVVVTLNVAALVKWIGRNELLVKNISVILLSGVIMVLSIILITNFNTGNLSKLIWGTIVGIIVYGVLLVLLNAFTKEELKGMPMANFLIRIRDTIRFWERADDKGDRDGLQ
jgi:stage V sporulation protein B